MSQLAMFSPPELSGLAGIFDRAADEWGLNCGPGAICGALAIPPEWVRPHLGDFEQRGHMTPTQMWAALRSLGVDFEIDAAGSAVVRTARPGSVAAWPRSNGICIGAGILSENGWLPRDYWAQVVPHLLPEKGDGHWWLTHTAELRGHAEYRTS